MSSFTGTGEESPIRLVPEHLFRGLLINASVGGALPQILTQGRMTKPTPTLATELLPKTSVMAK